MLCKLQSRAYAIFSASAPIFAWLGSAELYRENLLPLGYIGPEQGRL
jgi:hypothetical protein